LAVAGKTGTPERIWKSGPINDGWYVFFAPKGSGSGNLVVCVRVESTKGSSDAVHLAGKHVIPFLLDKRYVKSMPALIKPAEVNKRVEMEMEVPEASVDTSAENGVE
jgi:hypothetical protein